MNAWTSIQPEQAAEWNRRLLGTAASVYQYPYWNEPYRPLHLSPTYLVYGDHACPAAYVCVLSVRVPGGRIGLALRGPVVLGGETSLEPAWESLTRWARDSGYIFVRFSNSNAGLLDSIAGVGRSERVDPFPFFRDTPADVVVELRHDEQAMLASFSRNAHKDIRKASEAGYEVREEPPDAFADAWPMFQAHARRKGFRYNRPLSSWIEMIRLGQPHGCVGFHSVDLRGRRMAAFLMYRDGTTVHGISAVDAAALDRRPNPSALIHWQLMRHYRVLGCTYYDLGADTGSLYHFKQKFHPVKQQTSAPLTLVVNAGLYRLWPARLSRFLLPFWRFFKPLVGRWGSRTSSRAPSPAASDLRPAEPAAAGGGRPGAGPRSRGLRPRRQGRSSSTRLNGVAVARRNRVKPACVTTSRSRFSPACAPSASPTSWASDAGVQTIVDAE